MKFNDAKKHLDSQVIEIGIGFFFTGKKLEDFGKVYEGDPEEFESYEEYEKYKDEFEKKTREKYEAEKEAKDPDVVIRLRQPTLDEIIKISGEQKKLPISLNTEVPEIAKVVLEYYDSKGMTTVEQMDKALDVIKSCYIDDTFEGEHTAKELFDMIRKSKDLSMEIVQKFFASLGK
jgi:hypothetical protein